MQQMHELQASTLDAVLVGSCEDFDATAQLRVVRNAQASRLSLSDLMVCPVAGERFSAAEKSWMEPCRIPTCGCLMSRAVAAACLQSEKCAICSTSCAKSKHIQAAPAVRLCVQLLQSNDAAMVIDKFDQIEEDSASHAPDAGFTSCVLRGQDVTVFAAPYATGGTAAQLARGKQRIVNGLCMQKMASMASSYVCPVLAVCETKFALRIAVPRSEALAALVLRSSGGLGEEDVLQLGVCVSKGLSQLHEKDLLHLDLCPESVYCLCDPQERTKQKRFLVADFWASRMAGGDSQGSARSGARHPCTAPEEKRGKQSDIFSLGMILVFAATREYKVGPVELARLPGGLQPLVTSMVSQKQSPRPESMGIVAGQISLLQQEYRKRAAPAQVRSMTTQDNSETRHSMCSQLDFTSGPCKYFVHEVMDVFKSMLHARACNKTSCCTLCNC
jgi:hypothetical protein